MSRSGRASSPRDDHVYTVTELTRGIQRLLESHWSALWVEGELSNVSAPGSGHVYFTLKDERCQLSAVLFRAQARGVGFRPESGQRVRAFGQISVYGPRGSYQLRVTRLEQVGVGELDLAFRRLRDRLRAEGLFAVERKRPLPEYPGAVALVTSGSGAAVRDLIAVTGRRAPHVRVVVRPTRVQGDGAAREVARAIREVDDWGGADVIIVARGGGSLEDLWAFNEEVVARAIHGARTPVISAIGHEVDYTIADFAADWRAATPSAAAEIAVPERTVLRRKLHERSEALAEALSRRLRAARERVKLLARTPAFARPMEITRARAQEVDRLAARMEGGAARLLERKRLVMAGLGGRLEALSPLAILDRGYSVVRGADGRVLSRAGDTSPGEAVDVRLASGELSCRVEQVRETEHRP